MQGTHSPRAAGVVLESAYVERRSPTLIAARLQSGGSAYFGWLFTLNQHYLSRYRPPGYDAHIQLSAQRRTQTPYGGPLRSFNLHDLQAERLRWPTRRVEAFSEVLRACRGGKDPSRSWLAQKGKLLCGAPGSTREPPDLGFRAKGNALILSCIGSSRFTGANGRSRRPRRVTHQATQPKEL